MPSFPDLTVKAKYATEHRCGIVVSGPGLSDEVTGTDPLRDNLPSRHTPLMPLCAELAGLCSSKCRSCVDACCFSVICARKGAVMVLQSCVSGFLVCRGGLMCLALQVSRALKATAEAQHTANVVNELSSALQKILQVRIDVSRLVFIHSEHCRVITIHSCLPVSICY